MEIIKMEEKHILKVAQLEKECFSVAWSENALREEMEQPNAKMLVAQENGEVLGYGGMQLLFGEGFVTNIAVFKNARRKGLGEKITLALADFCEISISLEVRKSNFPAISLYQKLGFKEVGYRKNFYENPTEDALIYTLTK